MVYCGRLSLVADLLQGLFKEAYTLQKGLLELLDRISLDSSASDEEVSDIVTGVCLSLYHRHPLYHKAFCLLFLYTFSVIYSLLKFYFFFLLSDSQPAGYLLYYLQLGHSSTCKHMEIPHQVSTADTQSCFN